MLTETKTRQVAFSSERVFFTGTGLWFAALTIAGFWNTFYYRALPDPLPTHQILHGVLYSGWVALFLAQAVLISTKRVRWHVALGSASVLLLVLMIPAGFHVVLVKTLAGLKSVDEAGFNLVGLTLGFAFAVAGLLNRAQPPVHKRLMMFATLMLTVAAADRVALALGLDDVRLFRKVLAVTPGLALANGAPRLVMASAVKRWRSSQWRFPVSPSSALVIT